MNARVLCYWATTLPLTLELLVGGEWDLVHRPAVVQVVTQLGYPAYLLTILGFWKLLAGVTLLAPRLARVKEWAYAGIVFELSGAAASQAVRGHASDSVGPLVLLGLALASWALRPPGRMLGTLLPAKGKGQGYVTSST